MPSVSFCWSYGLLYWICISVDLNITPVPCVSNHLFTSKQVKCRNSQTHAFKITRSTQKMYTWYVNKRNLKFPPIYTLHDRLIKVFELRNRAVHENDRTGSVKKKTTNNKSKKPHTTV